MPLVTVQYARAIAAMMVVVFHLRPQLDRMGFDGDWPLWLASGVDIFFIISGYIMWWTTRDASMSPGAFMRRRLLRIVPLYWAITSFYVAVLLIVPGVMQASALEWPHALSSFLFLPYPHPVIENVLYPLVTPGWTLNFEMFFYVVFATALLAPRAQRLWLLGVVLVGLVVVGAGLQPEGRFLAVYTSTLLLEFLLGALVAELVMRGALLPRWLVLPAAAAALVALALLEPLTDPLGRGVVWGLPAALFIYAVVSGERLGGVFRAPALLFLGNASYSIYLTHQLTLSAAGQAWRKVFAESTPLAFVGFGIAATLAVVVVGGLCYLLVERPANRLARRLFEPRQPMPDPGTPAFAGRRNR